MYLGYVGSEPWTYRKMSFFWILSILLWYLVLDLPCKYYLCWGNTMFSDNPPNFKFVPAQKTCHVWFPSNERSGISYFWLQACTGVEDVAEAFTQLEAANWDLMVGWSFFIYIIKGRNSHTRVVEISSPKSAAIMQSFYISHIVQNLVRRNE